MFRQALAERRWAEAVQLYSGELLKGFALESAPEFTSWLELERAELHHAWGEATLNLADELEGTKRYAASAQVLERLYKADFSEGEPNLQSVSTSLSMSQCLPAEHDRASGTAAGQVGRQGFTGAPRLCYHNVIP
jgi:DNA-binding SARP family transcriptional activator